MFSPVGHKLCEGGNTVTYESKDNTVNYKELKELLLND